MSLHFLIVASTSCFANRASFVMAETFIIGPVFSGRIAIRDATFEVNL